jgi:hypothetical protein
MGYAAHRAWTVGATSANPSTVALAKHGATLYTIQLGLNLIWMPLFFRFGRPIEATADVVALTGVTGWLIYVWGQVDETAGYACSLLGLADFCQLLERWLRVPERMGLHWQDREEGVSGCGMSC